MPAVFEWLQRKGNIETMEMYRTFNCGTGMIIVASATDSGSILQALHDKGAEAWEIGRIEPSQGPASVGFE